MKIGFTGTQEGMTEIQKECVKLLFNTWKTVEPKLELHHGDCTGADYEAHKLFFGLGNIIIHPPDNSYKRAFSRGDITMLPKPYLERNKDIVDTCDVLIAAPKTETEVLRSGTWATIRYARKIGKDVFFISPGGKIERNMDKLLWKGNYNE